MSIYDKLDWFTIDGGAKSYVEELILPFKNSIRLNTSVIRVTPRVDDVEIELLGGERLQFDKCIMACHADQSMRMLSEEASLEKAVLSNFSYQKNVASLHTDSAVMPGCSGNWASWNYKIQKKDDETLSSTTHYWMNSLQGVSKNQDYFVTIDNTDCLKPRSVLKEIEYEHPVFSVSSFKAQDKVDQLNQEKSRTKLFFAGSYFKYGFHEDAFTSAVNLSERLLGRPAWG